MGKSQKERKAQQEIQANGEALLKDFEAFQKESLAKYGQIIVPVLEATISGIVPKLTPTIWRDPLQKPKEEKKEEGNDEIPVG